jgi:hypothetical protein
MPSTIACAPELRTAKRSPDHHHATGHAFADIIVGVSLEIHVEATGSPHAEALACCTFQFQGDRCLRHAMVAVAQGDLTGQARADRAVRVVDFIAEFTATRVFDRVKAIADHLFGKFALVPGFIALCAAKTRQISIDTAIGQDWCQVQFLLGGAAAQDNFQ